MENRQKKRLKILYSHMKGITSGGSDTCLYSLLKEIDQSIYEPVLLYKNKHANVVDLENNGIKIIKYPDKIQNTTVSSAKIKDLKSNTKEPGSFKKFLSTMKRIIKSMPETFKIASIIIKNNIDIIHCNHNINSDRAAILAAIFLRKKIISHNRGLYNPIYIDRFFSLNIRKIINMSDFSKNVFTSNGIHKDKCITIYDGIDINKFKSSNIPNNNVIIGCVGRLEKWKGQHVLIDAAEIVVKEFPNAKFQLIGDGNYENELRKRVDDKNLREYIEFTGGVLNVQEYIDKCTIVVHTSIEPEPFGMVVVEAMALEKPVIATNFGGPLEIIDNEKDSFLIPANRPQILAEYLIRLLKNDDLRIQIGKNAREKVINKFDVVNYTRKVEQVYQEITK